jgi:hypothetical protein
MTEIEEIKAIYLCYPRHVGCRAALKAIQKAAERLVKEKAQPDEHAARRWLWKRAKEYALSPAGQNPPKGSNDYRPHPSTWMNQDRFFDEAREWQKPNGVNGNGRQQIGSTKADRTVDAARAAVQHIENCNGLGGNGHQARRGDERDEPEGVFRRTIEGTV